jgi:hypothetical protein
MDKAIVERALRALAEIGAARPAMPEPGRKTPELANPAPATQHKVADKPEAQSKSLAPCGSSDRAGCYDVGARKPPNRADHASKDGTRVVRGVHEPAGFRDSVDLCLGRATYGLGPRSLWRRIEQ